MQMRMRFGFGWTPHNNTVLLHHLVYMDLDNEDDDNVGVVLEGYTCGWSMLLTMFTVVFMMGSHGGLP